MKLKIVIAVGPWDFETWRDAFVTVASGRKVHMWPQDGVDVGSEPYVICSWKASEDVFSQQIPPAAVFSLGAGVDHLACLALRPSVPVARIIDSDLTMRMVEYVSYAVLHLHRQIPHYLRAQASRQWAPIIQPAASSVRVGILGAGVLGRACGEMLKHLGFQVSAWARTPRTDFPYPVHVGAAGFSEFLGNTDILVNLLPNTPSTVGVIDARCFEGLSHARGAGFPGFVNAGRGETVNQGDMVQALKQGAIGAAVLDVFEVEPLAEASEIWNLPNVLLTPHVAADSEPTVVVSQIIRNIEVLEQGGELEHPVDLGKGY
ncbi:2-hydroxyacid dehydrogenase [Pseudomonas sp. X4]|uniref:2-hydroxyacid dehydrogenase n=1 Tax=Pseudomonas sp. X4 TaxID=3231526 RepID=UPI003460C14D